VLSKNKNKNSKLPIEKTKRFSKMHAIRILKTRNPRGCNHRRGCYRDMPL
jgi:hypothetical protein